MKKIRFFALCLMFIFSLLYIFPEKNEKRDVILLIDISNSMRPMFNEVQKYLVNDLIPTINVGDNLYIISFYGKTETAYNKKIDSQKDLADVKNRINGLSATGNFTDIGGALDQLKKEIAIKKEFTNSKYVLLLSDGSQEMPKGTKYYSPNHMISHELLKNAQSIDKKGWKIQVLSLGSNKELKKIAEQMGATYKETSSNPTKKEISEKNADFYYKVEYSFKQDMGTILNGRKSISGKAVSTYDRKVLVDISKVTLEDIESASSKTPGKFENDMVLRDKSLSLLLKEKESKGLSVPLKFSNALKSGKYKANLKFYFNSDVQLNPTIFPVTFTYPGFFLRYLFILLLLLLLLVGGFVFLFMKKGGDINDFIAGIFQKKAVLKYDFAGVSQNISKNVLFKKNEKKSLGGGSSIISLPAAGIKENIATISLTGKGFILDILKPEYFTSKITKDKFLDKEIEIKGNSGKVFTIKFSRGK